MMYRNISFNKVLFFVLLAFFFVKTLALAQEDATIAGLKGQIEALQKRVEELEAQKRADQAVLPQGQGVPSAAAWDPFDEIKRMQDEMNLMFQGAMGRSGGRRGIFSSDMSFEEQLDLKETDQGYEIVFDMKGLDKNKIDVQVDAHSVTVKGESVRQEEQKTPQQYYQAHSVGSFMKTIPLPMDADTSKVKTEKQGESLVIRLPKKTNK